MTAIVETALHKFVDRPFDVALRELVKAGVAAHAINPVLHRVLNEQVQCLSQSASKAKILNLLREFLQQRGDQVHFHNLELTVFIFER